MGGFREVEKKICFNKLRMFSFHSFIHCIVNFPHFLLPRSLSEVQHAHKTASQVAQEEPTLVLGHGRDHRDALTIWIVKNIDHPPRRRNLYDAAPTLGYERRKDVQRV